MEGGASPSSFRQINTMSTPSKPLTREEVAAIEVGKTGIDTGLAKILVIAFLLIIMVIPFLQHVFDVRGYMKGERNHALPGSLSIMNALPVALEEDGLFAKNRKLLQSIGEYDDELEDESFLTKTLLSPVQLALTKYLGAGNEQAYVGKDGWLYYRPGFDHVTGPPFLDEKRLERIEKTGVRQPDPVKAIVDFKEQLAERGIELIVMPVAVKPTMQPEGIGGRPVSSENPPSYNPSTEVFLQRLKESGVNAYYHSPEFLKTDTHWLPFHVLAAASMIAGMVDEKWRERYSGGPKLYELDKASVTNYGDVAVMLQLPGNQQLFPPEVVEMNPVSTASGDPWRSREDAEILLLGDSFANIYSLEGMGWGANAGLAEQLSFELQAPVDKLCINDNGAFASRELLQQELANGNDRLAGKKVVIWEFASRELSVGDWKLLDMAMVPKEESFEDEDFFLPDPGTNIVVNATIEEASMVRKPGSVPYKDHIRTLHLVDIKTDAGDTVAAQAAAYVWSMKDNELVDGAKYDVGDTVRIQLEDWGDREAEFGSFNRSELDGDAFLLADYCWGALVKAPEAVKEITPLFYAYIVGLIFLGAMAVQRAKTLRGEDVNMNWKKTIAYTASLSVLTLPCFMVGTQAKEAAAEQETVTTTAETTQAPASPVDNAALGKIGEVYKGIGDKTVYEGKDGWLFLPSELRHLSVGEFWGENAANVSKARNPSYADPLPTILDLHAQLKAIGVELVFMPVPTKASIYADKIVDVAPGSRIDTHHQALFKKLTDSGVNVIDLTPKFLAARSGDDNVYCQQDTHWATKGISIAAGDVAAHIKAQAWYKALTPKVYEAKTGTIALSGDLRDMLGNLSIPKAEERLVTISEAGKPVAKSKDSPVLILGDSHTLVFGDGGDMHTVGAGFPDHLAHQLGIPVDLIGIRGSGVGAARRNLAKEFIRNPSYAESKKVVVWLFAGRDLTESSDGIDWRPLPMKK